MDNHNLISTHPIFEPGWWGTFYPTLLLCPVLDSVSGSDTSSIVLLQLRRISHSGIDLATPPLDTLGSTLWGALQAALQ